MKKSITALMLCFVSIVSLGQIQFQEQEKFTTREITKAMGGNWGLVLKESTYKDHTDYYFTSLTTNRFDDAFIMQLGHSEEDVKASLQALLKMLNSEKGASFTIDDKMSATIKWRGDMYVYCQGYAGFVEIRKNQIEKLIKFYENGGH